MILQRGSGAPEDLGLGAGGPVCTHEVVHRVQLIKVLTLAHPGARAFEVVHTVPVQLGEILPAIAHLGTGVLGL